MEQDYNEQDLVIRAVNGNLESLSQLLYYNYNKVYSYMVKLTFNPELAADLTQEACTKAIERLEQYQPERAAFSTWLVQIAINTCKDWYRKDNRQKEFFQKVQSHAIKNPDFNILGTGMGIGVTNETNREQLLDLYTVLASMAPKIRLPLILKYYYGYEQAEIARFLGIPTGTVKSRLSNGLKKIRRELSKNDD